MASCILCKHYHAKRPEAIGWIVKARASECWSVCVGLEDWRAKYKQIIAGGAMIVREFCDFRVQRKQCDFIICDVLSERLPVRLAA